MKGEVNYQAEEQTDRDYPVFPEEETQDSSHTGSDQYDDTLVFLDERRKKKVDETIESPERYVSRYHYDSKNLDS